VRDREELLLSKKSRSLQRDFKDLSAYALLGI